MFFAMKALLAALACVWGVVLTPNASGAFKPLVVEDFLGKQVSLHAPPQRIVAMMPALAEAIIALGGAKRLVGVPDFTEVPEEHKTQIKVLGPYPRLSSELLYSLKPDLLIASMDGNDAAQVKQLESLGLKAVTLNTTTLDEILRTLRTISTILGYTAPPEILKTLVAEINKEVSAEIKKSQPKVFIQIGWNPLMTVSSRTFIGEILERVGGKNVFANAKLKYPRPNSEEVLAANPNVIIICPLTENSSEVEHSLKHWRQFKTLNAVKTGRIHVMPVNSLTKPGFGLTRGIRELRKLL